MALVLLRAGKARVLMWTYSVCTNNTTLKHLQQYFKETVKLVWAHDDYRAEFFRDVNVNQQISSLKANVNQQISSLKVKKRERFQEYLGWKYPVQERGVDRCHFPWLLSLSIISLMKTKLDSWRHSAFVDFQKWHTPISQLLRHLLKGHISNVQIFRRT
jgi:hypothetical protein